MAEIGRMTDADGELLIFETYSDGSAGVSNGEAQRFRLCTQEQADAFAQLLNATFLLAEREAERAQPSVREQAREDVRQMWNAAFGHNP